MYILRAFAFLFFLAQVVFAEQPTPILPDPKLTSGDTFDVSAEDVCVPGYAKKVRAVPAWLKRQAYAEYGITQYKTGDYEVDHLIPLSLGGSNSIRNLWRQLSLCELFGIEFCSLFGIRGRPSHRQKHSASEPCFDLRCGEFSRSTGWNSQQKAVLSKGRRCAQGPCDRSDKKWHRYAE
jgi:hypothetical protein